MDIEDIKFEFIENEKVTYWLLNPLHDEFHNIPKKIKPLINKNTNTTEFKLYDLGWRSFDVNFISKMFSNKFSNKCSNKCSHK